MVTTASSDKGLHLGSFPGSELIKILPKLASKASSGELRIDDMVDYKQSKIMLKEGRLFQVNSDLLPFHLGDILVKRGAITQKNLEDALSIQSLRKDTQQHLLGKILSGFNIKEELLNAGMFRQFEFVFYETLFFQKAEFYFRNISFRVVTTELSLTQDPNKQMMTKFTFDLAKEGDKNWPVLSLIKPRLAPLDHIPKYEAGTSLEQLTDVQKDLLKIMNGKNNLRDLLLISNMDYFGIYAALFQLIGMGIVSFVAPSTTISTPPIVKEEIVTPKEEPVKETLQPTDPYRPTTLVIERYQQSVVPQQPQSYTLSEKPKASIDEQNKQIQQLTAELQKFDKLSQLFNEELVTRLIQLPFKKKQIFIKLIENILDMNEVFM